MTEMYDQATEGGFEAVARGFAIKAAGLASAATTALLDDDNGDLLGRLKAAEEALVGAVTSVRMAMSGLPSA